MSQAALLREITATYQKYGWTLRRVLLTDDARRELSEALDALGANVAVETSSVNALWFSRTANEREAWELRSLSASPYALFESFDKTVAESTREKARQALLKRLQATIQKRDL
jgi:hypothetical protein